MSLEIDPFDPVSASEADLAEQYALDTAVMALDHPEQAPPTLAEYGVLIRRPLGPFGPIRRWVARSDGRIIGHVSVTRPEHENHHLSVVRVIVLPERRREGVGTELLRTVLPELTVQGRSVVMGSGVKADAAGEMWARQLGFVRTLAFVRQRLTVAKVDPALWQRPVADGFRVQTWTGAAPEELIANYANARKTIVDAPNGDSTMDFEDWTSSRVRAHEADLAKRGATSHVTVAVHEATGEIAGLTEIALRDDGHRCSQLDTAVLAAYRGHGLGLAIKGTTLRWLTAERPEVQEVYTQTAVDNEPMIRINLALGYDTTAVVSELEVGVGELVKALAVR